MAEGKGLLERERELGVAESAMEAAVGGEGGVLLFLGPAGIGKTRLLEALRVRASGADAAVLTARASQLETGFPFGVARQLFEPLVAKASDADAEALLSGAAGLARPLLGLPADEVQGAAAKDSAFASLHGLHWLVSNLSERSPVVLLVDDAHWADADSLRFLAYLATRVDELPALVAATVRTAETATDPEPLDALLVTPGATLVEPSTLSEAAVAELASTRLGDGVAPEFARACHVASGGNPFYCGELLSAAAGKGVAPDALAAASVADIGPETVGRAVLGRLGRLPEPCTRLARAVAVLGSRTELRDASALADLGDEEAAQAADALAGAEILRRERPLDFAHPIVRNSLYRSMGPLERAEMHSRAARELFERGADAEDVAVHLLEVEPSGDHRVADVLRTSAAAAAQRGAPRMAATHLKRALEEPPPAGQIPGLMLELGLVQLGTGQQDGPPTLKRAVELAEDPKQRLGLGLRAARALGLAYQADSVRVGRLALESPVDRSEPDFLRLAAELVPNASLFADTAPLAWATLAEHRGSVEVGSSAEALMLIAEAWEMTVKGGSAQEATELIESSFRSGVLAGEQDSLLLYMAACVLVLNEGLELAGQLCDVGLAQARSHGWPSVVAASQWLRANIGFRLGNLADSGADAAASVAYNRQTDVETGLPWPIAVLSDVLVEQGKLEEASEAHASCVPGADLPDFTWGLLIESRGRLRLAQGRHQEAVAELREAGRRWEGIGMVNLGIARWRTEAVQSLVALDRRSEAQELAAEQLEIAHGAGASHAIAMALRTSATAAGGDDSVELLTEAVELLEGGQARLELAHCQVALGTALRRSDRGADAREPLNQGMALARRCGATRLAEQAYEELQSAGAKPRKMLVGGVDALTPSERRVALMAAEGLSNKEIAQTLFVTVRTVETHLRHTYQKLDVPSREGLAPMLQAA